MNRARIVRLCAAAVALSAWITAVPAASQTQGGIRRPGLNARRPQRKNYLTEFKTAAESLAKKHEVRIVVDPLLFVASKPQLPVGESLDDALKALITPVRSASWRRVYLLQSAAIDAEKLSAAVRSLELVEQSGLVLENPALGKATSYYKNFPVPAAFQQNLADQQFEIKPVYVIYNAKANAEEDKSPEDRMLDLQREQMELMMQMDEDSLSQSMARGMQLWNNFDPQMRTQVMGTMMRAGMQMFQSMSPADQQNMMQMMMQNAQGLFGGAGGPPRPNP